MAEEPDAAEPLEDLRRDAMMASAAALPLLLMIRCGYLFKFRGPTLRKSNKKNQSVEHFTKSAEFFYCISDNLVTRSLFS